MSHFSIHKYPRVNEDGSYTYYPSIVIVDDQGLKHFTNYGKYVTTKKGVHKKYQRGNNEFSFIRMLLEYAFFYEGIDKLSDLTVDIVRRFFEKYHDCSLPWDSPDKTRNYETMSRCRTAIFVFCSNLSDAGVVHFKKDDLYTEEVVRDRRRGRMTKKKTPVFNIYAKPTPSKAIFRDIPGDAFDMLFAYIRAYHPELLGLVACGAFAGLRPSEACHVRRTDCQMYGPGIRISMESSGRPSSITIDLMKELKLRSDDAYVGDIKKEREQVVPQYFRQAFYEAINEYLGYVSWRPREEQFGALNINAQGKCYTYSSYKQQFQTIVSKEVIPLFTQSGDQKIARYGRILMEHSLSPHVFRHWYTVKLVLSGMTNPAELMFARGDTSPESALTYINNKADLEQQYKSVNNEYFDYIKWVGEKIHGH